MIDGVQLIPLTTHIDERGSTFIYGLFDPRTYELRYIGKADNPKGRLREHIKRAKSAKARLTYTCYWIRELLSENLKPSIEILEEVPLDSWQQAEIEWIAECKKFGVRLTNLTAGGDSGFGFNLTPEQEQKRLDGIAAQKGVKRTDEQRQRMRESHLGKGLSEETKRKLSEAHKGKNTWSKGIKMSASAVEKMRLARVGKVMSDESKRKLSESRMGEGNPMFGKTRSEETRKKASESLKGRIVTDEHRANLSKALKGHNVPEEARKRWSEMFKGRKLSEETKKRMSESQKKRWAKVRSDKGS